MVNLSFGKDISSLRIGSKGASLRELSCYQFVGMEFVEISYWERSTFR